MAQAAEQTAELHPIFAAALALFMQPKVEATECDLERLNDAHQTVLRFGAFEAIPEARVRDYIRATNVLVDHCIRCGMATDYPDHEAWAAERIARWLLEA